MKKNLISMFIGVILVVSAFGSQVYKASASTSSDYLVIGNQAEMNPGPKATEMAIEKATGKPTQVGNANGTQGKGNGNGANPGNGKKSHFQGILGAKNVNILTVNLKDGSSVAITVLDSTRIHIPKNKNATLADLQIGSRMAIQAQPDSNAALVALMINAIPGKPQREHQVGVVTAYTPGASITIQNNHGDVLSFTLTANTRILPQERAGELAVGSWVTIIAPRDPSGGPATAQAIVVHPAKAV
jgi:Domain of unknown function (DUF5666)